MNFKIRIFPFANPAGKVLAYASLTLEDLVEIKGFRIIDGANGMFVSAPSSKGTDKTTGKEKWYNDVRFLEERDPENQIYRGPFEEKVYQAMLDAFTSGRNDSNSADQQQVSTRQATARAQAKNRPSQRYDSDIPF